MVLTTSNQKKLKLYFNEKRKFNAKWSLMVTQCNPNKLRILGVGLKQEVSCLAVSFRSGCT